jgi:cytochrome c peroxidase
MNCRPTVTFALLLLCSAGGQAAVAQNWLVPPPEPAANPSTPEKVALGMALFWDEQLSSTQSVACGTCHRPESGGSDPRSFQPEALHPGADGLFHTHDDVLGSPGVIRRLADGNYAPSPDFGLDRQVTGRKANSAINALLNATLFWDGRAEFTYRNPITGQVVLPAWAALESQAVGPPMSSVEMAFEGRDWQQAADQITALHPLALSPQVPSALAGWIAGRDYQALFAEAFASPGVDVDRIAMAIAAYERSLLSNQTPLDAYMEGDNQALTAAQLRGLDLFQNKGRCVQCHTFPQLGRQQFQYTGVHQVSADLGRGAITGNPADDGKMLTPGLRNVALRTPLFHDGSAATLSEVIDFYDRGGDFDHANKSLHVAPIGFTSSEKADLLALLEDGLIDDRVASASGPFVRPLLRSEDPWFHLRYGSATAGSGGIPPRIIADDPARLDAVSQVAIADGSAFAPAWLAVDLQPSLTGIPYRGVLLHLAATPGMQVFGPYPLDGTGLRTLPLRVPNRPQLLGRQIYLQAILADPGGPTGFSATSALTTPLLSGI